MVCRLSLTGPLYRGLSQSMREAGTGLSRRRGKCAGNSRGISEIGADLVFRGAQDHCSHNANEISALRAELVFREVPGKLVERRGHSRSEERRVGKESSTQMWT